MKRALRWFGALLFFLVFVLVAIIAWGTGLPIGHTAACSAEFSAAPHAVWTALHAGDVRWVETDAYGHAIAYQLVSSRLDRELVRRIADPTQPFGGSWTYEIWAEPHRTRLSITEDGEIYNPVFRLMARYFFGYTGTMRRYLADLGKHFGQAPAIECRTISRG